jgi:hypothetical protein
MIHQIPIVSHVFDSFLVAFRGTKFPLLTPLDNRREILVEVAARFQRQVYPTVRASNVPHTLRRRIAHANRAAVKVVITKDVQRCIIQQNIHQQRVGFRCLLSIRLSRKHIRLARDTLLVVVAVIVVRRIDVRVERWTVNGNVVGWRRL